MGYGYGSVSQYVLGLNLLINTTQHEISFTNMVLYNEYAKNKNEKVRKEAMRRQNI